MMHASLVAKSCLTLCDPMDCSPPGSSVRGDSPGKNTGVGCHFLLHGIFQIWRVNPHLLCLLHWQADSLPLSHLGSPEKRPGKLWEGREVDPPWGDSNPIRRWRTTWAPSLPCESRAAIDKPGRGPSPWPDQAGGSLMPDFSELLTLPFHNCEK